ncbi:MAG: nucleotidyltransferase family protein [Gemmatimonadota bacterium]
MAIVFGPENGAVSEKLVFEAAKEANAKELCPPVGDWLCDPTERAGADRLGRSGSTGRCSRWPESEGSMSVTAIDPGAMPSPEEIARRITERFDPERIVLFGSRARGDYDEDSDVDVFVEMESDQRPPERFLGRSSASMRSRRLRRS